MDTCYKNMMAYAATSRYDLFFINSISRDMQSVYFIVVYTQFTLQIFEIEKF